MFRTIILYRPIIKWRFLKELIAEGGWIAGIAGVILVVILDDIFNDGLIFGFLKPVTSSLGRILRKLDHSVQKYPDEDE